MGRRVNVVVQREWCGGRGGADRDRAEAQGFVARCFRRGRLGGWASNWSGPRTTQRPGTAGRSEGPGLGAGEHAPRSLVPDSRSPAAARRPGHPRTGWAGGDLTEPATPSPGCSTPPWRICEAHPAPRTRGPGTGRAGLRRPPPAGPHPGHRRVTRPWSASSTGSARTAGSGCAGRPACRCASTRGCPSGSRRAGGRCTRWARRWSPRSPTPPGTPGWTPAGRRPAQGID